jgi:phosphoglycolate phosphatase-like HAD superfamily hydrolase
MKLLENYSTFFWDFDGVILDSNSVREFGFKKVLENFPEMQVNQLLDFHRINGGLSRYVKFRYFYETILGESITDKQVNELADSFSKIMLEELIKPDYLISETVDYLKQYSSQVPMYIVSGSDQTELRFLCEKLGLASCFKGIYGSPTPKIKLVETILNENPTIIPQSSCLIGDSHNDFEAAQTNGLDFLGYNNEELQTISKYYITSFKSC